MKSHANLPSISIAKKPFSKIHFFSAFFRSFYDLSVHEQALLAPKAQGALYAFIWYVVFFIGAMIGSFFIFSNIFSRSFSALPDDFSVSFEENRMKTSNNTPFVIPLTKTMSFELQELFASLKMEDSAQQISYQDMKLFDVKTSFSKDELVSSSQLLAISMSLSVLFLAVPFLIIRVISIVFYSALMKFLSEFLNFRIPFSHVFSMMCFISVTAEVVNMVGFVMQQSFIFPLYDTTMIAISTFMFWRMRNTQKMIKEIVGK
ncbi:MAG: hypothetical protein UX04_C0007G0020 [Microgenomates group bacterium GW2011_GWF2_45_18]|nr:MAG: hypothetical protein UW18_C0002G0115 [Microgenomates group bacterium GW2011_GWF1_44_10]KKU01431.1 MAG: hypothetical protein UX04_C0007G0020 [Microgenomates group bacterium GW2011_GWF2_45_18]OGJ41508.1 MAG: hypothetical protein A2378_00490 [Candidatus Pacebacteria bacterium RIFOXYB1_FULL_44_10]HAU98853.1 hypothetical protein [Candidatus Paceibacterota bacterium]HAX01189.1 hypothetical protein [Candidatus Paceibacterota bacterium]